MGERLRVLYLPLLGLTIAFAVLLALLNWALVIKTGWLPLDEDVVAIWLPLGVAFAAVGFLIVPRLHVLAFNPKYNMITLYAMVAILCVAGPAILVQEYLQATSGEMVTVRNGADISQHPEARYFMVASPCLNKNGVPWHPRVSVGGDHDEDLNVDLYYAVPFCDAPVWVGMHWSRTFDNRLNDTKKDALFQEFLKDADRDLGALDLHKVRYFDRIGRNSYMRELRKALKDSPSIQKALREQKRPDVVPIFVTAHTEPFPPDGKVWLGGTLLALIAGAAVWLVMVLIVPLLPLDKRLPSKPGTVSALFIPHRESFGLPLLIDVNLLVYLAMVLAGLGFLDFEIDDLIAWGASSGSLDHGWGLVRLLTATFLHAGLFHILGNMYGLLTGGALLSVVARNTRMLFVYAVSGIGGSLLSKTVHPDIVMVGASGAIFGFFGALIALVVLRDAKIVGIRRAILINVGIFVGINLIYGFSTPGVDNFAHVGGFLTGLLCGGVIYVLDRLEQRRAGPAQGGT